MSKQAKYLWPYLEGLPLSVHQECVEIMVEHIELRSKNTKWRKYNVKYNWKEKKYIAMEDGTDCDPEVPKGVSIIIYNKDGTLIHKHYCYLGLPSIFLHLCNNDEETHCSILDEFKNVCDSHRGDPTPYWKAYNIEYFPENGGVYYGKWRISTNYVSILKYENEGGALSHNRYLTTEDINTANTKSYLFAKKASKVLFGHSCNNIKGEEYCDVLNEFKDYCDDPDTKIMGYITDNNIEESKKPMWTWEKQQHQVKFINEKVKGTFYTTIVKKNFHSEYIYYNMDDNQLVHIQYPEAVSHEEVKANAKLGSNHCEKNLNNTNDKPHDPLSTKTYCSFLDSYQKFCDLAASYRECMGEIDNQLHQSDTNADIV